MLELVRAKLAADAAERVKFLAVHQLDVGMAADLAESDLVVFVDAWRRAAPPVEVVEVVPGPGASSLHGTDPEGLLGLVEALYGRPPRAVLLAVAAPQMGHGEGLSETAEAASVEAASVACALLAEFGGRLGGSVPEG